MGEKGRIRENDSKDKGIKRKGFIWFSYWEPTSHKTLKSEILFTYVLA